MPRKPWVSHAALTSALLAGALLALSACSGDDDDDSADGPKGGEDGAAGDRGGSGSGASNDSGSGSDRAGSTGSGDSGSSAAGRGGTGSAQAGNTGNTGNAGNDAQAGDGEAGTGDAGSGNPDPGELPQIAGCTFFTADDPWNQDISGLDVHQEWTDRLQALVGDVNLHPDYGNYMDEHYGIPINTVPADQPKVDVEIEWYPEESDPGPYPFPDPDEVRVEGGSPDACDGDCHVLVVQEEACMLYEGYACGYDNGWHCGGEATWNLSRNSYGQREEGWTSADAAGLSITAGLVRFEEVQAGEINHAIRFTVECTRQEHVPPASHHAVPDGCDPDAPNSPPMGLRVRMRDDYDISGLSEGAQVVARAMKRYGMILADNGSNFYFQGDDNPGWTEELVEPLKDIPASAFEVVATDGL